ncbi:MAG: Crp/Fnr family transcriptional regulator [Acidimicrobiaceae bacterium]|nr:Crp/Fnr family transcriptional regulator [Acidimicrobiaceae bacterium]
MDVVQALAETELFAGATPGELQAIAPAVRLRVIARGAYLWHAGDPTDTAWVVRTGLLKVVKAGHEGQERVVHLAGPGDWVGEYHLFEQDSRRIYDAVAVERSECLVLARTSLQYQLERNPALMRRVAAALIRRAIRVIDSVAAPQLERDIAGRVQTLILALANEYGQDTAEGRQICLRLDQSVMAALVGASRENVNRALRRLVMGGLISIDGRLITLLNESRLRQ